MNIKPRRLAVYVFLLIQQNSPLSNLISDIVTHKST